MVEVDYNYPMAKKKLVTEEKFSNEVISKNTEAIAFYKTYIAMIRSLNSLKYSTGQLKTSQTKNNSTLNTKINYNGIASTQDIRIDTGLA